MNNSAVWPVAVASGPVAAEDGSDDQLAHRDQAYDQ